MCGLVGVARPGGLAESPETIQLLEAMRDRIAHRGPDDSGIWFDEAGGLALGFRRLSIIDISDAGHQPMLSADGRIAMVMNGEIYNFAEIKAEIEAISGLRRWRGHSDTEILVEAVTLFGFESAIRRTNGMFAVAAWDRAERVLWLARDRIGKKPLHYGWAGRDFVFASEIKALWPHPEFDATIDADAQLDYMQLGYVLGERTIFRSTRRLPPGCVLKLDPRTLAARDYPTPVPYWSLRDAAARGLDDQAAGRGVAPDEFEALLEDAVRIRMVSDVPLGAFLSGGLDSSLVTALMAGSSRETVRSYSIGFQVAGRDEAPHAEAVANHLGTRHKEMYVTEQDVLRAALDVPNVYDEPFADDSAIPTLLLCRMARREVTVALSGDGGDELFAGYDRYAIADRWLARARALPAAARLISAAALQSIVQPLAARYGSLRSERRFELLRRLLRQNDAERFNETIMSQVFGPERFVAGNPSGEDRAVPFATLGCSSPIDRMTFMDLGSFLIDDILMKVDRASMAASLEVRCPLLDYRVIEQSWRFPAPEKTDGRRHKLPMRRVLYKHVPQRLIDRPKMGFGAPVDVWLRKELRDWAESLMSPDALAAHGLLDVSACRRLWDDFAVRGRGWHRGIWHVLMFQAWYMSMRQATRASGAIVADSAA